MSHCNPAPLCKSSIATLSLNACAQLQCQKPYLFQQCVSHGFESQYPCWMSSCLQHALHREGHQLLHETPVNQLKLQEFLGIRSKEFLGKAYWHSAMYATKTVCIQWSTRLKSNQGWVLRDLGTFRLRVCVNSREWLRIYAVFKWLKWKIGWGGPGRHQLPPTTPQTTPTTPRRPQTTNMGK